VGWDFSWHKEIKFKKKFNGFRVLLILGFQFFEYIGLISKHPKKCDDPT